MHAALHDALMVDAAYMCASSTTDAIVVHRVPIFCSARVSSIYIFSQAVSSEGHVAKTPMHSGVVGLQGAERVASRVQSAFTVGSGHVHVQAVQNFTVV